MKRSILPALIFAIISCLNAQENIKISAPQVSVLENIMTIRYDITGCRINDYISIKLIVLNSKGDTIRPVNLRGDVGSKIPCGAGKKIEWDIARDNLKVNEELEIQVAGKLIKQEPVKPEPVITRPSFTPVQKTYSRGNIMLSSFFIPGLGQKKASGKGGHLWMSVFTFGSAGASLYCYQMHSKYYNDYIESEIFSERDELYKKSADYYKTAKYLLYGSAGLWVINMITATSIPIKKASGTQPGISLISQPGNGYLVSAKWNF